MICSSKNWRKKFAESKACVESSEEKAMATLPLRKKPWMKMMVNQHLCLPYLPCWHFLCLASATCMSIEASQSISGFPCFARGTSWYVLFCGCIIHIISGPSMTSGIFTQDKTFQEIQTACAVDVKGHKHLFHSLPAWDAKPVSSRDFLFKWKTLKS